MKKLVFIIAAAAWVTGCTTTPEVVETAAPAETADEFVARVNAELTEMSLESGATSWVRATYINHDTAILAARSQEKSSAWHSKTVAESLQYEGQEMSPTSARSLKLLKLRTSKPAPNDAAKRKELAEVTTALSGMYGAGKYCPGAGEDCLSLGRMEELMADSRDFNELLELWVGWRKVAPPMRPKYRRFAELANEGAGELGYGDLGEMWRAGYDMSPTEFQDETLRLFNQVKPLYDELHCHVRAKLAETYGEDKVPLDQPIPAHLLGNMWSQTWSNIYDLLQPYPNAADLDVTATLIEEDYSPQDMVRSAESFYESLGFDALPATFWERSQFSKPRDRDVQCHASAWGLDAGNDLRIKMCIQQNYEELGVIYHELGHNMYQRAYKDQPALFRAAAHSGFHEAIGDTVVLAMTPGYLQEIGLIDSHEQSDEAVINDQMIRALDGIAFLPFGKLIDEWRWGVFSGEIAPEDYNKAWWELRTRYQGIAPPVARSEADFDPGAKYHVPANASYTRYFLARFLQFQFLEALCDASGYEGPLHECSFYGSEEAGARFNAMLEAGASEPWQDTLEKLTGTREMDGSAIISYFQPLMGWLQEQNADRQCGW